MGARGRGLTAFVLVHSPLVGPLTWAAVADDLRGRGVDAVVPDLGEEPSWQAHAVRVATAVQDAGAAGPLVLAGHSGAGPALPAIGAALTGVAAYLFVDAGLPRQDATRFELLPDGMAAQLRDRAVEGVLPPWSSWWGDGVLAGLLPDEAVRERFVAELRPVPVALFEERLPVPEGWPEAPCGYARLSDGYDAEVAEARRRGWPVAEIPGHHLEPLTDPANVATALLLLAGANGIPTL